MNELRLKRIDGNYYLYVDGETIRIEEWEAGMIIRDHSYVYDVITDRKRKYNFNTSEDKPDSLMF